MSGAEASVRRRQNTPHEGEQRPLVRRERQVRYHDEVEGAVAHAHVATVWKCAEENRAIVTLRGGLGDAGGVGVVHVDEPRPAQHQLFGEPERRAPEHGGARSIGQLFPIDAQNERGVNGEIRVRILGGQGSSALEGGRA